MPVEEEFAKELARQLPVKAAYDDIASPAAKQTGQLLEDIIKALQVALAPVQLIAALQDRYRAFLNTSVRRVPETRRISPPTQIIGPVLEGIRYEPEGTPIDEMFSELLSRSMDRDRVNEAHPAYPILIRQLSSDEAKILSSLNGHQFDFIYTSDYNSVTNLFHGKNIETDSLPRNNLVFPDNVSFYLEHLNQLGLAGLFQEGNQEALFDQSTPRHQVGVRVRAKYRLTEFGQRFVRACIGANTPTSGL